MNRPTSVTVIAWIYIGLAGLMVMTAVLALAVSRSMPQLTSEQFPTSADPVGLWLFRNFGLLGAVQVAIALLMLLGATAFLKLRPWGRTLLEIIAWLALAYVVVFGVFWVRSAASTTSRMASDFPEFPSSLFITMGAVLTLVFAVPIVVVIRFLRGKIIRDAVAGTVLGPGDQAGA